MAQLVRTKRSSSHSPKTHSSQTSPSFEQLLRVEDTFWSPRLSSQKASPSNNDPQEGCFSPINNKKSVLTKVKDRAMKLRHSLSGKKKQEIDQTNDVITSGLNTSSHDDDITPPSTGVTSLDDDNNKLDEDPEYLGAPMYESVAAPDTYKETARQHPRANPVLSEKHVLPCRIKSNETTQENDKPASPNTTITEKLGPAYAAVADATHKIASKIAGLTITTHEAQKYTSKTEIQDERAVSQAITDAISPTKTNGDSGVVEKVKEVVTSLFWHDDEPTQTHNFPNSTQQDLVSYSNSANSSSLIPVSTNASEAIEEENHGKILQAN